MGWGWKEYGKERWRWGHRHMVQRLLSCREDFGFSFKWGANLTCVLWQLLGRGWDPWRRSASVLGLEVVGTTVERRAGV